MDVKRYIQVVVNWLRDKMSRHQFARKEMKSPMLYSITLTQPLEASPALKAKQQNLRLAAKRISQYTVHPGEVFSFWRAVGNPYSSKFRYSPAVEVEGVKTELGGVLCVASGLIYGLAAQAGLEMLEAGNNAWVAYGQQDLRLRNNTPTDIRFELFVDKDEIVGHLFSSASLVK